MFIIKTQSENVVSKALAMCLKYERVVVGMVGNYLIIKVATDSLDSYDNPRTELGLCELDFQMNWVQEGAMLCPYCIEEIERTGEGEATCGHLVFTKPKSNGGKYYGNSNYPMLYMW